MKQKTWWSVAVCGVLLALLGLVPAAQAQEEDTTVVTPPATAQEKMKQMTVCTTCHDETEKKPILAFFQHPHGSLGDPRTPVCQTCHGESKKHLDGAQTPDGVRPPPDRVFGRTRTSTAQYEPASPQVQSEVCLSCHKGSLRMRWPGSQHESNDVACTNCHLNHNPVDSVRDRLEQPSVCFTCHKEKRAEFNKISHMPLENGKVICSDCHNPHGSPGPKLLVKNTVTETCFTCHADKRGPFLWEHQAATEDCTNCHNPHGSNITPLLKDRPPFLCESCHNGPHNSVTATGSSAGGIQSGGVAAGGNPSVMVTGRACLNCHVMVHGSNSPAGAFLHR
ncbi:MAG: DmsE family decaheme c-type cytochrome [Desulfovibrionaceae bacterium]|nr:DmsE family decaheme c-type cytochrome [Desulfovibrionaceae bacterium]